MVREQLDAGKSRGQPQSGRSKRHSPVAGQSPDDARQLCVPPVEPAGPGVLRVQKQEGVSRLRTPASDCRGSLTGSRALRTRRSSRAGPGRGSEAERRPWLSAGRRRMGAAEGPGAGECQSLRRSWGRLSHRASNHRLLCVSGLPSRTTDHGRRRAQRAEMLAPAIEPMLQAAAQDLLPVTISAVWWATEQRSASPRLVGVLRFPHRV